MKLKYYRKWYYQLEELDKEIAICSEILSDKNISNELRIIVGKKIIKLLEKSDTILKKMLSQMKRIEILKRDMLKIIELKSKKVA